MAETKEQLTDYINLTTDNITEAFDDSAPKTDSSVVVDTANENEDTKTEKQQNKSDVQPEKEKEKEKEAEEEEEEKYGDKEEIEIKPRKKSSVALKLHAQPGTEDKEKRVEVVEQIIQNKDGDIIKESELIYRIYDHQQQVPKKVHSKKSDRLNKVDPKWKYNITLGDMEFRKITHYDGTEETLWFPMEEYPKDYQDPADEEGKDNKKKKKKKTPPRKVFVALKVKRVSAVDNIAETV